MAPVIINLPTTGMTNKAQGKFSLGISRSRLYCINSKMPKATTPKEPVRLSFMISNILSRSLPEKMPSTVSIKPSQWIPPVAKNGTTAKIAARKCSGIDMPTISSRPQVSSQARTPYNSPSTSPTKGKYLTLLPKSSSVQTVCFTTCILVRNCKPIKKAFIDYAPPRNLYPCNAK